MPRPLSPRVELKLQRREGKTSKVKNLPSLSYGLVTLLHSRAISQPNLSNSLFCFLVNRSTRGCFAEELRSSSSPSTGNTFSAALLHCPSPHSFQIRSSLRCRRARAKCCGCVTTWTDGLSSSMVLLMRAFASRATQCHRTLMRAFASSATVLKGEGKL
jgi:hypothetical protein